MSEGDTPTHGLLDTIPALHGAGGPAGRLGPARVVSFFQIVK
ncbi:MAG: hypothetical protein OXH96_19180 [Spirochaetaceae bacterium]|nr:hypothetical protein [Spirochaetaceae bacterium]